MARSAARHLRIVVDRGKCTGAGGCAAIAPEVFDQSPDDGVVVLLQDQPPPSLAPAVEEAVDICPVAAISLRDS